MKKVLLMMSIAFGLTLVSCSENQTAYDRQFRDFTHTWYSAEIIESVGLRVSKFNYDGCEYLMFLAPEKGGTCVVHNPNCKNPDHQTIQN